MTKKNILILSGDGIGTEVCQQVEKIIELFNKNNVETSFNVSHGLIGGIAYDEAGSPLPDETLEMAKKSDAVLLGAVGGHKWESLDIAFRPESGLLKIRKELDLFANLRPAIVYKELVSASSLKQELVEDLDLMIIRELTGGIYFGEPKGIKDLGNGILEGHNTMRYNSNEIERIARVAFDVAKKRGNKLCSVDKANVLVTTELWRNTVQKIGDNEYKDVDLSHMYVDNAAMQLVRQPKQFDVMLTTNLFGDILSDCAAMLTGSLGMLPSASLGSKDSNICSALYEPVHGSAPDIAGKNIANPIATILSFSMMLRYSFENDLLATNIENSIKSVLAKNYRTADIFKEGNILVGTNEMGDLIVNELKNII